MTDDPVYLDHNATTPVAPEVVDAMLPYLREHFGNPSSGHVYGRRAREALERARSQIADAVGARPDEIVITSGGTESSRLAILGTAGPRAGGRVVTTAIEHPATVAACEELRARGWVVERLGVDGDGVVRAPEAALDGADLLTVMHANNETGVLQPVGPLAALAARHGVPVHTDAAQSIGKVRVAVDELGVTMLTIAGHKMYAPKGVGALFVRRGHPLTPLSRGGGQERGLRAGTENVAYAVGLGEACRLAAERLEASAAHMTAMRDRLWDALRESVPGLRLHGHPERRLPNTLNVGFPGVQGTDVLARAPGVAASTGSACHDGITSASEVLLAMGVAPERAVGAVRLTVGRGTRRADVDRAAAELAAAWRALSGA